MPFWSDETWRSLPDEAVPVEPFSAEHLEEAKYIMAVGDEIFISSNAPGNTIRKLKLGEGFQIAPGQFAYILTAERVKLPANAIGFISINAKTKFAGLVNISGFHVDPGYNGKIIFSVFNAGPKPIHLKSGNRIFPIWIADLDKNIKETKPFFGYEDIPSDLITGISGNYTTAFELNETVRKLRDDLDQMREHVTQLKSVRLNLTIILSVIAVLFSGVITDRAKALYSLITSNSATTSFTDTESPNTIAEPTALPKSTSQPTLPKIAPTK